MPTDDYPELPRAVQLACQTVEPEHLLLPAEDLRVVVDVSQSIHAFVSHCTPNLDAETVGMTTYHALLAVQRVIEQAARRQWDVTAHD